MPSHPDASEAELQATDLDDGARSWLEEQLAAVAAAPVAGPGAAPEAEVAAGEHVDARLMALLDVAERRGASDVHLATGKCPMVRLEGVLVPLADVDPLDPHLGSAMLKSVLSGRAREELDRSGSADSVMTLPSGSRARVNVYRGDLGLAGAFRILPDEIPTLEQLGLPPALAELAGSPRGLLLVTGPTGSGKTTTIASLIDWIIGPRPLHVVTLEDPIEYRFSHRRALITQRQIGEHAVDFAGGLRQALRQDPDVLVIGEMRDPETIAAALTAAETGHLVISTLHSRTAQSTVSRIVDSFGDARQELVRTQLANALVGVVSQQLITRNGGLRCLAAELLVATPAVRNLIREGALHQIGAAIDTGAAHGMQSMDRALAQLVRQGRLTRDEAFERCVDPNGLQELL